MRPYNVEIDYEEKHLRIYTPHVEGAKGPVREAKIPFDAIARQSVTITARATPQEPDLVSFTILADDVTKIMPPETKGK